MSTWISDRHMRQGGSLNSNPSNNGSQNGPLRKVFELLESGEGGIFGKDKYRLECGHEQRGTKGANRVRCKKCKQAEALA